jgi:hypothetical protein
MSRAARVSRIVVAATLAGVPCAARAQTGSHMRAGAWFSGGFAYERACYSRYSDRHCLGGPALGLGFGRALNATVQVGAGSTGLVSWSERDDELEVAGSLTGVVRVHPVRRAGLVLTGGLGIGSILLTPDRLGLAAEAGLGYDLSLGRRVSLAPYLALLHIADPYRPTTYRQLGLAVTLD